MPQTDETMPENLIKSKIAQLKSEHPVLAGILGVQSMNALDTHARNILPQKVAGAVQVYHRINFF